ncbi:hypothetical protein [Microcoleus sp. herbarium12]
MPINDYSFTSYGDKLIMPYKERLYPLGAGSFATQNAAVDSWSVPHSL